MRDADFEEIEQRDYDLDFIEKEAKRALQEESRNRLKHPDDIIYWLVQRIRELEAAMEPELVDAAIQDGTLRATVGEHPGIKLMVASFRESLGDAVNYVETKVYDDEADEMYIVRVQKASGDTPHEKREKAEGERDAYHQALDSVHTHLLRVEDRLKDLPDDIEIEIWEAIQDAEQALASVDVDKED